MRRTLQPEGPIAKWNPSSFLYSRAASAPRCGATPGGSSRSARFSILGAFVVYATWAAFQGDHYAFGPYLSPFYSPELFGDGAAQLVRARSPAGGRRGCRSRRRC